MDIQKIIKNKCLDINEDIPGYIKDMMKNIINDSIIQDIKDKVKIIANELHMFEKFNSEELNITHDIILNDNFDVDVNLVIKYSYIVFSLKYLSLSIEDIKKDIDNRNQDYKIINDKFNDIHSYMNDKLGISYIHMNDLSDEHKHQVEILNTYITNEIKNFTGSYSSYLDHILKPN